MYPPILIKPLIYETVVTCIAADFKSEVPDISFITFSGSKSQQKTSSPAVMKEDKLLNPASRRVKDAAENLLSLVMEQVLK